MSVQTCFSFRMESTKCAPATVILVDCISNRFTQASFRLHCTHIVWNGNIQQGKLHNILKMGLIETQTTEEGTNM